MGQANSREIVLLGVTTVTTSGTGADTNMIMGWQSATLMLQFQTVSGTLPTIDVYIQQKLTQCAATDINPGPPTGTGVYDDVLHFTQMTTTNSVRLAHLTNGPIGISTVAAPTTTGPADWAQSDAALGAGLARVGPLGGTWRVKYVIGGTTPSFAFSVTAMLVPFST